VVAAAVAVVIVVIAAVTVAEAAVAAEDSSAALDASVTTSATDASASSHDPLPANSNVRAARGTGEVARAPEPPKPVVTVPPELAELAATIGQAWSVVMVQSLEAQGREIVGAWPGTLREARRQVLAKLRVKVEPEQLDQLAKLTNLAARRGWETVSEPDLES
jgi:hypothetical protein